MSANELSSDESVQNPLNDIPNSGESTSDEEMEDTPSALPSLYLRFAHAINPERDELKKEIKLLNERIVNVRTPRRKSARFVLVDFTTKADQKKARIELAANKYKGKSFYVGKANREKTKLIKKVSSQIAERRSVKRYIKRVLNRIKTNSLHSTDKDVTNSVVLCNVPAEVSESDVKGFFPDAIKFVFRQSTNMGEIVSFVTVTLPTPADAKKIVRSQVCIKGCKIGVTYQQNRQANGKKEEAASGGPRKDRYYMPKITDEDKNDEDVAMNIYC